MRIAYLIVAHHEYNHLQKLIKALLANDVFFFLHLDKKANAPAWLKQYPIHVLKPQEVTWGAFSQVEVSLGLLHLAKKKVDPDYFVLLSGVDYPLKSNAEIAKKFITEQAEYLNIESGFKPTKPATRVTKYHFQKLNRRTNSWVTFAGKASEKMLFAAGVKRRFNMKPYVGSNWFALSKACVSHVLNYVEKNPVYIKLFKYSLCADEIFFHTIIGNSPFLEKCKHNLTYADWAVPNPPAVLSQEHLELFKKQTLVKDSYGSFEPFFARKFSAANAHLLPAIEKNLRQT